MAAWIYLCNTGMRSKTAEMDTNLTNSWLILCLCWGNLSETGMSVAYDMHRGKKQDTGSQRVCCLHALLISDRYLHTARIGMAAWVHCQHASRALISKMNKFNTTVSEEKKEKQNKNTAALYTWTAGPVITWTASVCISVDSVWPCARAHHPDTLQRRSHFDIVLSHSIRSAPEDTSRTLHLHKPVHSHTFFEMGGGRGEGGGLTSGDHLQSIRDGAHGRKGVWRQGKRDGIYLLLHRHHQNDLH